MTVRSLPAHADRGVATSRRRRGGALLGLLAGLSLMGALGAPSAFAHTDLESSNPADGGTVDQAPTSIQLVFADTVRGADPVFTITVAGAAPVEAPAVIDGATVTADLSGVALPTTTYPASWEVGYRLVALDGDAFRGDITFTVAAGPAPAGSSAPTSEAPAPVPSTGGSADPTTPSTTTPTTSTPVTTTSTTASAPAPVTSTPASSTASSTADVITSSTTAAADSSSGGAGWWWFGGVVLVVLVAGGGYGYARTRRTAPPAG